MASGICMSPGMLPSFGVWGSHPEPMGAVPLVTLFFLLMNMKLHFNYTKRIKVHSTAQNGWDV